MNTPAPGLIASALLAVALLAVACSSSSETAADPTASTDEPTVALTPTVETVAQVETPTSTPTTATTAPVVEVEVVAEVGEASTECPESSFLIEEVNSYQQTAAADPELAVVCSEDSFTVTSNGIPNFEFVQITPNGLEEQNLAFTLPLEPAERETAGSLPLGPIGISANGLAIFGAFEAPNDGYKDPLLDGLLDYCNGHTAPGGLYHFHARYDCVFEDPEEPGLVYGYAADGYPILSPNVCADTDCTEVVRLESSYVRIDPDGLGAFDAWEFVDGAGDLDECNGSYDAEGDYAYYATDDFPYLTFCFHGETDLAAGDFIGDPPVGR